MSSLEKLKQYPLALWALALYLCSLGFSFKYDVPLALLALASVYSLSYVEDQYFSLKGFKEHGAVIFFIAVTAIVTIFSRDIKESIWMQMQLLPALLAYLCISLYASKVESRNFVIFSIIFSALLAQCVFMIQALLLVDVPDRLLKMWAIKSPLLIAPNDVLFFSIWVPLAIYLIVVPKASNLFKAFGVIYLFSTLFVTVYMQSRQAVGVYLGGLFFLAVMWRPAMGAAFIVFGVGVVLIMDWFTGKGLLSKLVYMFPRRYVWEAAWQMFVDRPWVGHGPGMFKDYYLEYLGKAGYVFDELEDRRPMNWAHSLYLEQLAERGLIGFMGLFIMVGTALYRLRGAFYQKNYLWRYLLACWGAFLMAGIAESSMLRLWAVVALFVLLGLTVSSTVSLGQKRDAT